MLNDGFDETETWVGYSCKVGLQIVVPFSSRGYDYEQCTSGKINKKTSILFIIVVAN